MWGVLVIGIFLIGFQDCKPPERPNKWDHILDDSKDSTACIFIETYPLDPEPTYGNSEDSLNINVYSPVEPNSSVDSDKLVVQIHDGKVRGTTLSTPNGNSYNTWRHIPFAKPPLAELRFQPPERPDKWDHILDGSKDSPACIFIETYPLDPEPTYGNSEDCLYINVYSPVEPNSSLRLPVIFAIHGGGFISGSADSRFLDPAPFMEENVIIVSFNYRLGVFGFLSTEDDILPGNSALKDQHQALLWTKENIVFFGGNPDDITIYGESAGANSVGYLLVSSISRNLVSGAIMQSGNSLRSAPQVNARNNAIAVAKQIQPAITTASSSEHILSTLQSVDAELLINLTKGLTFKPVMEPRNNKSIIYEPIYEALEKGSFAQVPVMIGVNSEEALVTITNITYAETLAAEYDLNKTLLMPEFYKLKAGVSVEDLTEKIKKEYVGNGSFTDNVGSLIHFLSDNRYARSSLKQAILQSQYSPVYFFQFNFVGTSSLNTTIIPDCGRVSHAQELPYIFNVTNKLIKTDADYLTRRRLIKLWANFARTKNPTPDDDLFEELQNVKWEPFNKNKLNYLEIGDNLTMKSHFKANRSDFWDRLWMKYSDRPYNTF